MTQVNSIAWVSDPEKRQLVFFSSFSIQKKTFTSFRSAHLLSLRNTFFTNYKENPFWVKRKKNIFFFLFFRVKGTWIIPKCISEKFSENRKSKKAYLALRGEKGIPNEKKKLWWVTFCVFWYIWWRWSHELFVTNTHTHISSRLGSGEHSRFLVRIMYDTHIWTRCDDRLRMMIYERLQCGVLNFLLSACD